MRLSIVIPVYLGHDVIAQCIESILRCGVDDSEVIAIDDCSPDGSGEMIRSNYPTVKLVANDRNRGYAASVNRGLSVARGKYILLLNQDTLIRDDAIEKLSSVLDDRNDIVAVAPQLLNPDSSIQNSCRMLPSYWDVIWHHLLLAFIFPQSRLFGRWRMEWFSHDREAIVEQPSFSAIMIRRATIDEFGSLDERFRLFFNDVDYCRRIVDHGGKILFFPSAKVTHQRGHSTSQLPIRKIAESHSGFIRYFLKHNRGAIHVLPNALTVVMLGLSGVLRIVWRLMISPLTSRRPSSGYR